VLRSDVLLGLATIAMALGSPVAADERALRIAVLGDSLALGTGASRADGGFVFRAFRTLLAERPGSRIDNVAIGGATVADVTRLEVARLAGSHYDIAIVCVGANDVVHATPAATFATAYRALLAGIAHVVPAARVVCCGVPDVSISPLFADERSTVRHASVANDRAVRAAARAAGASFVDLFAASRSMRDADRFLGRDRFHPSDAGYAILTNVLTPVLERAASLRVGSK
jgi:lysophospholipase L1-like esterase